MVHTRAADDFHAIRARMEELRREHEQAPGTETERGSVSPRRRGNNNHEPIVICLRRLRSLIGQRLQRQRSQHPALGRMVVSVA
jgi:hypothetical protein